LITSEVDAVTVVWNTTEELFRYLLAAHGTFCPQDVGDTVWCGIYIVGKKTAPFFQ